VQPQYYNHKFLSSGIPRLPAYEPVFPFGHGLSYTRFEYHNLSLSDKEISVNGEIKISCDIRNSGDREGDEVVQLYVQDTTASITRPVKELKGFKRITLRPDEQKTVVFTVPADMFTFTGPDYRKRVEPGEMIVFIGSSSREIRLSGKFDLTGEVRFPGENRALSSRVEVR